MSSTATIRLTSIDHPMALLLVGPDHLVSFANAAAHQLLGYPQGGLHGLPLERLLPPTRAAELQNIDAVLAGQGSRRVRSVVTRASGSFIDVNLGIEACHDHDGKAVAVSLRYEPARRPGNMRLRTPEIADAEMPCESLSDNQVRLDSLRMARLVGDQLAEVQRLLSMLDEQLVAEIERAPRLRSACGVLAEAIDLVEDCELDLAALVPDIGPQKSFRALAPKR